LTNYTLDFGVVAVPEPSAALLMVLSGIVLLGWRPRRVPVVCISGRDLDSFALGCRL
jgi:hypothetical protein